MEQNQTTAGLTAASKLEEKFESLFINRFILVLTHQIQIQRNE